MSLKSCSSAMKRGEFPISEVRFRSAPRLRSWIQFHVETLMIHEPGFNQNYWTFTLILLMKIVLCSKFPSTGFIHLECFDKKSSPRRRYAALDDAAPAGTGDRPLVPHPPPGTPPQPTRAFANILTDILSQPNTYRHPLP